MFRAKSPIKNSDNNELAQASENPFSSWNWRGPTSKSFFLDNNDEKLMAVFLLLKGGQSRKESRPAHPQDLLALFWFGAASFLCPGTWGKWIGGMRPEAPRMESFSGKHRGTAGEHWVLENTDSVFSILSVWFWWEIKILQGTHTQTNKYIKPACLSAYLTLTNLPLKKPFLKFQ